MVAAISWHGYDITAQAFSDYSAIGAPTRLLILILSPIYSILVIAFGLGVWLASRKLMMRIIGILFIIYALVSWVWPQFFPIHLIAAEASSSDLLHIVLTFVTVVSWLIILGLGMFSFGKRFRIYSIGTFIAVIVCGALTGYIVSTTPTAVSQSAPWLGIIERIILYSFMVWMVVLATILLKERSYQKTLRY